MHHDFSDLGFRAAARRPRPPHRLVGRYPVHESIDEPHVERWPLLARAVFLIVAAASSWGLVGLAIMAVVD